MAKKLNKQECDALLEIFNGKKNTFESKIKNKLNSQDVISLSTKKNLSLPDLLPIFQFIYEVFCRSAQNKLSIEHKANIYLKSHSVDIVKFGEYKKNLEKDSLTFIFNTKELHCSILIHVENFLSSSLLNKSLGSNKSISLESQRVYSKIDEMTVYKSVYILSKELEAAISSAYERINLEFVKTENRSDLLSNFHPNDNVLLSVIKMSSESINGCFHVAIPGIALKQLKSNGK